MEKPVTLSKNESDNASPPQSKTESTIEKLSFLLQSCPAAEELRDTWERPKKNLRPQSNNAPISDPRLSDLYAVLQSGRSVTRGTNKDRGIPMWIVVRMCKASWHKDGTWPLKGFDEDEKETQKKPIIPEGIQRIRSIHPSALIIKAEETGSSISKSIETTISQKASEPPMRAEPSADEIAEAYRRRGIFVEEAPKRRDKEDDW